ncbi:Endoplasmic reticulum membrane 65 [Lecanosticta acicola]|uniref:Endoplasmic reticulum membrane 65 n=1 Tax=Lecanosticta acicola TaxID=111012 RepID=A0AAI8YWP8_9PEZI|nr:Endoplasmic reticulum membrane 65 [Lecanosticta acicola]
MNDSQEQADKGSLDTPATGNGQLLPPTLSPISEHGNGDAPTYPDISLSAKNGNTPAFHQSGEPEQHERRRSSDNKLLKLSPQQIQDLTTSRDSLPLRQLDETLSALDEEDGNEEWHDAAPESRGLGLAIHAEPSPVSPLNGLSSVAATPAGAPRPSSTRSFSTSVTQRKSSSSRSSKDKPQLPPLKTEEANARRPSGTAVKASPMPGRDASPMPSILPIPPLSLPTYLHLELSSDRPSPLYIHRSASSEFPYESSRVKFERLLNFMRLPGQLEQILLFGAIACLDAWLYTFTILPLRFFKAVAVLLQWIGRNAAQEALDLGSFVYSGLRRVWQRQREASTPAPRFEANMPTPLVPSSRRTSVSESEHSARTSSEAAVSSGARFSGHVVLPSPIKKPRKRSSAFRHRRTRSTPSALLPNHKADLLQGLLIILSCTMLMWFDASRMYHSIRGQAAIKLYVIYNVLEVFDRLFSALGQDVLECLFSKEILERDTDGRSKVLRPLWMFALALVYNVVHATALFYQVVTLNVAVNSYSNALLTLLMSNQFVEIKGTVFKKFEKENLFQLTCADVVERFQLWLMLSIIALRNIVEVGGLSISLSSAFGGGNLKDTSITNGTSVPLISGFVIPKAFTLFPKWTGEVLGPFLIVLGSEALVDWCKHAYITKFNNVKPNIYGRFLDVLAKDYYSHAFADQNLTKRLGLPVIPLSCLFIRACMQTYHMFLATHMPLPIPSAATSISLDSETSSSSPATTAALQHIDQVFRRALGRSSFGAGSHTGSAFWWSIDDFIAFATMIIVFLAIYLVLLACKLLLGMALLSYARNRYKGMKDREQQSVDTHGKRVGGWGTTEVGEDKRRWIYEDDPDALRELEKKERRAREKAEKGEMKLDGVERYSMAAKRIW